MQIHRYSVSCRALLGALFAYLVSSFPAVAQTAPSVPAPAGAAAEKAGEVTELSPFVVSTDQDRGYTATSGLTGTRVPTLLKESSAPVGILTKEFLEDIGATSVEKAAEWGTNAYLASGPEADDLNFGYVPNIYLRGIPGLSWSSARNYFIAYAPLDASTIERIEMPRGPNAALYGEAPLGGLVNANSKRAKLERNLTTVTARTDSEGSLRGTVDTNVAAGRNLAARANAMMEDVRTWRDGEREFNRSVLLSGTWRVNDTTTFRAEAFYDRHETSLAASVYNENTSRWDRTTSFAAAQSTNPSAATGTTLFSLNNATGADYWVFESSRPGAGMTNWKGFGRATGSGLALLPDADLNAKFRPGLPNAPVLPRRSFTFSTTKSPNSEKETSLVAGYLEHTFFNKLAVEVAYQFVHPIVNRTSARGLGNTYFVDVNTMRPTATPGVYEPNPHYGEAFDDLNFNFFRAKNWVDDGRLLATYPIKWGFMEQRFVLLAGQRRDRFDQRQFRLARANNPANAFLTSATNDIHLRRYASDGDIDLGWPGDSNGLNLIYLPHAIANAKTRTTYGQLAMAGRYWDGKLATTIGLRRDLVVKDIVTQTTPGNLIRVDEGGLGYRWNGSFRPFFPMRFLLNSVTAGAVYFPIKSVGIFANYSEGFNLAGIGNQRIDGSVTEPPKNKGTDVGIKLELLDGRLSGSISHYKMRREGVDPGAPQRLIGNFSAIWTNMVTGYTNAGNTTAASAAQAALDALPPSTFDSRTTEGSGWEVDLTGNLTKNWRAIFNYARPENKLYDSAPDGRKYLAEHIAQWTAAAADPVLATQAAAINSNLSAIDNTLAPELDGRTPVGTPDYTANFFTSYRVPEGRWKGLRFGGGMQFQGPRVIGVPQVFVATSATAGKFTTPDLLANLKSDSTALATAMVGYEFRMWQRKASVQLNVDNLFDEDKIVFTNYATYTTPTAPSATNPIKGYQMPNGYRFLIPRRFSLTLSVAF